MKDQCYIFEGGVKIMKQKTYMDKVKGLEETIEFHFNNISHLSTDSNTYKEGAKMIRIYAAQYKELTGDWYRRDWN